MLNVHELITRMLAESGPLTSEQSVLAACQLVRDGETTQEVAEALGVERSTVRRWIKRHPQLCEAVKEAEEARDARVETAVYEKALGEGNCDVAAAKFWLTNRKPKIWRDRSESNASAGMGLIINIDLREDWGALEPQTP